MTNLLSDAKTKSRIRILPDAVANQIAAGEVVERPASVLKELIENSLDASARSIHIAFRNGGKSYMEVSDDGCGLTREDAMMAFEPHATSKIGDAEDIKSIETLGFRGEALPSIASVSRIILTTSLPGASSGVEVSIDGGKLKNVRDAAPLSGLRIQLRDLFYNTPARRKFLRSESVEAGKSHEAVLRQALAWPRVAFRLMRDGKEVINAPAITGDGAHMARIGALFGQSITKELSQVDHRLGNMRIQGYVSRPQITRSNRNTQYVYINGRYVRDKLLNFALMEGFRSLVAQGRYPLAFLFITIAPEMVDVNVHPTKVEVRFRDTRSVTTLVIGGIQKALGVMKEKTGGDFAGASVPLRPGHFGSAAFSPPSFSQPMAPFAPPPAPSQESAAIESGQGVYDQAELQHFDASISDSFRPVGQIFSSFILLEDGDRLLLLDQHTAHERVLYEKLTLKYREGKVDSQELLFPLEIELKKSEAELLKRKLEEFKALGFFLDEFGDTTFTLRSAPALLAGKDHRSIILDMVDRIERFDDVARLDQIAEQGINIMACRGAVMAGDKLDSKEIEALVTSLKKCRMPYTCPHGRPIALTIEKEDLLKGFLRK